MAIVYGTLPVPAFPEYTAMVPAGAVTIGVEYRRLDEDVILAFYGPDARAKFDGVTPAGMDGIVEEDGLSLHVFGSADGEEYLRFDCFEDASHYHLLDPSEPRNVVVEHDSADAGPLLDWALAAIGTRLAELLREAGADELAAAVDGDEIDGSMDEVRRQVRRMLAAGQPVPVG